MITISTRATPGFSKSDREFITHFTHYRAMDFSKLTQLLDSDCCYSAFSFIGGKRSTNNICSNASFVVLDIDYTSIGIHERFEQMYDEGLSFIIGTTSDPKNFYRYRLLLPLSRPVTSDEYRLLVHGIRDLGLVGDLDIASAKPAQQFFSYKHSLVKSYLDGTELIVDDYLIESDEVDTSNLSPEQLLDSFNSTFGYCRSASPGSRTKTLLGAAFRMAESNFSKAQLITGVRRINSWFIVGKSEKDIQRRVINFILNKHNLKD